MSRTCTYCHKSSIPPSSTTTTTPSTAPTPLKLKTCARCHSAYYCSRECQRADWPAHKRTCISSSNFNPSTVSRTSTESTAALKADVNDTAYKYWNEEAHKSDEAKELAARLGLDFPRGRGGIKSGITYPLRRLILTGKDTAQETSLLLGPAVSDPASIIGYSSLRIHALLNPPQGSPAEAMYRGLDADMPSGIQNPRSADETEEEAVWEIQKMQERIQKRLKEEGQGRKEPNGDDLKELLVAEFGHKWAEKVQVWQDAVNTMDQGVDV